MNYTLIIDIITIALLITTIVYSLILNKRIVSIQENKSELKELMQGFTTTLSIAEVSVEKLRITGTKTIDQLIDESQKGKQLKEDLEYLIERGDKLANQLEDGVRRARAESTVTKNFEDRKVTEIKKPTFLNELKDLEKTSVKNEGDPDDAISEVKKRLIGKLQALR